MAQLSFVLSQITRLTNGRTDKQKDTQTELSSLDHICIPCSAVKTRCSAIAERPRCRVRYSFGQKWKTGTGKQYFTDIIGISSTNADIICLKIHRIRWKNAKIGLLMYCVQGHRGRYKSYNAPCSAVCLFLSMCSVLFAQIHKPANGELSIQCQLSSATVEISIQKPRP